MKKYENPAITIVEINIDDIMYASVADAVKFESLESDFDWNKK